MKKASVTVFMGMNLMLLLSVFFTLLEVLHYRCMEMNTRMVSDIAADSTRGDYNRPLWNDYGILAVDGAYGTTTLDIAKMTDRVEEYMADNAGIVSDGDMKKVPMFLRLSDGKAKIAKYGLITDHGGVPFMQLAAKTELYSIGEDLISGLSGDLDTYSQKINDSPDLDAMLEGGQAAIDEAEEIGTTTEEVTVGTTETGEAITETRTNTMTIESPIDVVKELKDKGLIALVIPEGKSLSEEQFLSTEKVSQRTLEQGTMEGHESLAVTDRLLYVKFLTDHFTAFTDEAAHAGAHYEIEYVIAGKDTDKDNLESIVVGLIAAREAMNFASIASDGQKMMEAEALAAELVGFTLNPAIVEGTKWGLVAAWAFGESILDIRALLAGKRIALVKSPAEWSLSLTSFAQSINEGMEAKECTNGFTYKDYLLAELMLKSSDTMAFRGMDVLEDALHRQEDYINVKMDHMVYCVETEYTYYGTPLFLSFVPVLTEGGGDYKFECERAVSYLDDG